MNAQKLFKQSGEKINHAFCNKCGIIHSTFDLAERCCKNYLCSNCGCDTGNRSYLMCALCRIVEQDKKELARFNKAEKLDDWDGPVYDDLSDKYWRSLEDFYDDWTCNSDDEDYFPAYLYCCGTEPVLKPSIDLVLDDSDWPEGGEDYKPIGLKELKDALEKFKEANKEFVFYQPDYSKVVLTDKEIIKNDGE